MIIIVILVFAVFVAAACFASVLDASEENMARASAKRNPPVSQPPVQKYRQPPSEYSRPPRAPSAPSSIFEFRIVTDPEEERKEAEWKRKRDALTEEFTSMCAALPGWSMWTRSAHATRDAFFRISRAMDDNISVLEYDPVYKIARIKGTGGIYLTSYRRCSCPDFRKRDPKSPCKHMYRLLLDLEGDDLRPISCLAAGSLRGLSFSIAGRQTGLRQSILSRGAEVHNDFTFYTSALVVSSNGPSLRKIQMAETYDAEIISSDDMEKLFFNPPAAVLDASAEPLLSEPVSELESERSGSAAEGIASDAYALPGVTVAISGAQTGRPVIWLSGEVERHAAAIEAAGAKWSPERCAYYIDVFTP